MGQLPATAGIPKGANGLDLKTVFVITITTLRMIFPGIPGAFVPGEGLKEDEAPSTRVLAMDLWSDREAGAQAKAEVTVPLGLKVGEKVILQMDRAYPGAGLAEDDKAESRPRVVMKSYWGCAEAVPEGQPRITSSTDADAATQPPTHPQGSYAYWPASSMREFEPDITAPGAYGLTTNYAGNTSIALGSEQDFLPAVELVGAERKYDLAKPVKVRWKAVPGARAYLVHAYGGNGAESITWTSSTALDAAAGLEERPITREEMARLIERKVLLPASATSCTIPAGIFRGAVGVILSVTAIGTDKVQEQNGIETRVIVRSGVSMPLITGHPVGERK